MHTSATLPELASFATMRGRVYCPEFNRGTMASVILLNDRFGINLLVFALGIM